MSLSIENITKLEKIANALDKTGEENKMVIADNIDELLRAQAALKKIAVIGDFHVKLISWLSANYPRAFESAIEASRALADLMKMNSGSIKGVGIQDLNNLRNELRSRSGAGSPGQLPPAGTHEIT